MACSAVRRPVRGSMLVRAAGCQAVPSRNGGRRMWAPVTPTCRVHPIGVQNPRRTVKWGGRWASGKVSSARLAAGSGRLAQRESASFTPKRSLVRSQYRPQAFMQIRVPIPTGIWPLMAFSGRHRPKFAQTCGILPRVKRNYRRQARVQDDGRRANVTDRHGTPARPRKLHAHSGFAVVVAWTEAREESSHCRPPHQP